MAPGGLLAIAQSPLTKVDTRRSAAAASSLPCLLHEQERGRTQVAAICQHKTATTTRGEQHSPQQPGNCRADGCPGEVRERSVPLCILHPTSYIQTGRPSLSPYPSVPIPQPTRVGIKWESVGTCVDARREPASDAAMTMHAAYKVVAGRPAGAVTQRVQVPPWHRLPSPAPYRVLA